MEYRNLTVQTENNIALLTLNRPDKLNALNNETIHELQHAFEYLNLEESVHSVIVTGAGIKAFAAGADISEINQLNEDTGKDFSALGQRAFNMIENMDKPVIAAVNGFALGGGCELALACHIRLASENAKFGLPEVNLGLIPGYGGTQRLTRLVNPGRAMEMILTGEMIDAQEAFRIGLVNRVYAQDQLIVSARELAGKIMSKGRIAVRWAIHTVNAAREVSQKEGLELEAQLFGSCCSTEDFLEGTAAFLQKRKPEFKNK